MIGVDHIEEWRGQQVLDETGAPLGKLEEVYIDAQTGTPLLIAIKSGLLGRRSTLVPIGGAMVGPDYVRVAYARDRVDAAAERSIDGAPNAEQLATLGTAYGLAFSERVSLQSATELEAHRAEAEAARRRADELEATAREKIATHEAAQQRVEGASDAADAAEREAAEARQAAIDARQAADRYSGA